MIVKKYYKLIRVSHEDSEYLRLKNVSNEGGVFKMNNQGGAVAPNLEYSLDGVTWTTYNFSTLPEVAVAAGTNIYFRGTNSNQQFNTTDGAYVYFSFNKTCELYGNMCSLLDPSPANFQNITQLGNFCFAGIFAGLTTITTAPNIGSVTTIGIGTFSNCFSFCRSLTTGIDLSNVTTCGRSGCFQMYNNCRSLTEATAPNVQDLTSAGGAVIEWWLSGVAASGTVRVPSGATIATDSTSGIPTGWTRVDY